MPLIHVLFFWVYIPFKIISWLLDTLVFNPLQRSIDRIVSERETAKAFGKLDNNIEIYDPAKRASKEEQ